MSDSQQLVQVALEREITIILDLWLNYTSVGFWTAVLHIRLADCLFTSQDEKSLSSPPASIKDDAVKG